MHKKNSFQTNKQFSFKLTKIAAIVCSSMLLFSALNSAQASPGDSSASRSGRFSIDGGYFDEANGGLYVHYLTPVSSLLEPGGMLTKLNKLESDFDNVKQKPQSLLADYQASLAKRSNVLATTSYNVGKLAQQTLDLERNSKSSAKKLQLLTPRSLNAENEFKALEKIENTYNFPSGTGELDSEVKVDVEVIKREAAEVRRSANKLLVDMRTLESTIKSEKTTIEDTLAYVKKMAVIAEQQYQRFKKFEGKADARSTKSTAAVEQSNRVKRAVDGEVKDKVAEATRKADEASKKAKDVARDITLASGSVQQVETGINNINAEVEGLNTRSEAVEEQTRNTKVLVEKARKRVTNIKTTAQDRDTQVKDDLVLVEASRDLIEKAKDTFLDTKNKFDVQEPITVRLKRDFDTLKKDEVVKVGNKLDALEQQVDGISSVVDTVQQASDGITKGVAKLEIDDQARSAKLMVKNTQRKSHGLEITGTKTRLTGGTSSSSLTLDDKGATFSDINARGNTDQPIKVTGIADGSSDFDAVNFRQLDEVSKAVAMSMAMDGIPQTFNGKGSIGLGVARFNNNDAFALGAAYHDKQYDIIYNLKIAQAASGGQENVATVGAGWKF